MKYAYNILVNFKTELINFYEWEKNDKITKLKKVPLFKINDDVFSKIINKNIKINKKILEEIKLENEYNCIFANDYDTVCVNFNEKGEIKKLSKLTLEDDVEILDYVYKLKTFPIEYEIVNDKKNLFNALTRNEQNIIKTIIKELDKLKGNEETIRYLYNEWFELNNNNTYSYEKLIEDINKSFSSRHEEFYKLIKLLTYKNA